MTVVKITVLETSLRKDLADEYAVPNLEPCPVLNPGQVFYATNTCPKGMCDAAWRTINQYVFALACGVREFYGGGWMKEPGKVITCCNDGLRPVYFKLEATDDEATISRQGLKERGARRPVVHSDARAVVARPNGKSPTLGNVASFWRKVRNWRVRR